MTDYRAVPVHQISQFTACGRKTVYPSRSAARNVAVGVFRANGMRLKPYKCPYCGLFRLRGRGVKQ